MNPWLLSQKIISFSDFLYNKLQLEILDLDFKQLEFNENIWIFQKFESLIDFTLSDCLIKGELFAELINAITKSKLLSKINFNNIRITDKFDENKELCFSNSLNKKVNLIHFGIADFNPRIPNFLKAFSLFIKENNSLYSLSISFASLTKYLMIAISTHIKRSSILKCLAIRISSIDKYKELLNSIFKSTSIEIFDFSNFESTHSTNIFRELLKSSKTIKSLNLSNCKLFIGNDFVEGLELNHTLEYLNLSGNTINEKIVNLLKNTKLKELEFKNTNLAAEVIEKIKEATLKKF